MTETKNLVEKPENPRKAIREARERRLRVIDGPPRSVKVYAANETLREVLRHSNGTRFRASLDQGVEWPNDSFTKRRIADGTVLTEPPAPGSEAPALDETKNPREQAAASKQASTAPKSEPKSEPRPRSRQQPEPPQPTA